MLQPEDIAGRKLRIHTHAAFGIFDRNDFIVSIMLQEKKVIIVGRFSQEFSFFRQSQQRSRIITHDVWQRQMSRGWEQIGHETDGFVLILDYGNHHFFGMAVGEENPETQFRLFEEIAFGPFDEVQLPAFLHRQNIF